jgi:hypothetical protein
MWLQILAEYYGSDVVRFIQIDGLADQVQLNGVSGHQTLILAMSFSEVALRILCMKLQ